MAKRILVIDDDAGIVEATTMVLEDAGYDVTAVTDPGSSEMIREGYPDLILLDVWLSGVDGRDVARDLKANPKTRNIPIIMFSANRDCEEIALEVGAEDFLLKPFDINRLIAMIEKHT